MAANFRILLRQNSDSLHVKLSGDFDGSSAHELIHTISKYNRNPKNIYIDTSSLTHVHPFGLAVFKKNWNINNATPALIFTGEHENKFAPIDSCNPRSWREH